MLRDNAEAQAEEALEEGSGEREALADLISEYQALRNSHNYLAAGGEAEPWPPPPPLDETDPVAVLPGRWRDEAELLRECGAEGQADALERCAGELETGIKRDASEGDRPPPRAVPTSNGDGDRLLRVEEVADRLGVKKRWLYDRSDSLPFARKLAPQTLRFSEKGLQEWIATRP